MNTPDQPRAAGEAAHTPTPWFVRAPHAISGQATIEVQSNGLRSKIAVLIPSHLCDEHGGSVEANAAFIVESCNNHARLTAENKALRDALADAVSLLAGLAGSELTIDQDRNRTPQRLVMRANVYAGLDAARAVLASTNTEDR